MSHRHEQFCSTRGCRAILKTPAEEDVGLCLSCLQRGEAEEEPLASYDRRGDIELAKMRSEDEYMATHYNLDMGLMRDSERDERTQQK